ncbi:transposase [Micromonospora sp. NPDC000119]|uniref:transposase n=1 Tax=unclassified Micromonospora TaxID=2617518 RepID=UPI003317E1A9
MPPAVSSAWSRAEPRWRSWRGCCRRCNARRIGPWPNARVTTIRRRCSGCCARPHGTPTACAAWLIDQLGHADGVLIADETGFLKGWAVSRGAAAVHRHRRTHRERPGRGVSGLCLAPGPRMIDRQLYYPGRPGAPSRPAARRPLSRRGRLRHEPALARQMITAALDSGVPVEWVTGDEVYGAGPGLRADLGHRGLGYLLAVGAGH